MLLIAALLATSQVASVVGDYVPNTGWSDNDRSKPFWEAWIGGQLRAMHEPQLAGQGSLEGYRERFRLTVLPSFGAGYAYRIDIGRERDAVLTWTLLSGLRGHNPGQVAHRGSRPLRRSEVSQLADTLSNAALATLDREDLLVTTLPDGTEQMRICADGTTFVFEHLSDQGRRFVVRNCYRDEKALWALANLVEALQPRANM